MLYETISSDLHHLIFRVTQHLIRQYLRELQFPQLSCVFQLQLFSQCLRSIQKLWFVSSR